MERTGRVRTQACFCCREYASTTTNQAAIIAHVINRYVGNLAAGSADRGLVQAAATVQEFGLQLQAGPVGHIDIDNEAIGLIRAKRLKERLSRSITFAIDAVRT